MVKRIEYKIPGRTMRLLALLGVIFGGISVVANLILGEFGEAFVRVPGPIWAGLFLVYTKERNESGYHA